MVWENDIFLIETFYCLYAMHATIKLLSTFKDWGIWTDARILGRSFVRECWGTNCYPEQGRKSKMPDRINSPSILTGNFKAHLKLLSQTRILVFFSFKFFIAKILRHYILSKSYYLKHQYFRFFSLYILRFMKFIFKTSALSTFSSNLAYTIVSFRLTIEIRKADLHCIQFFAEWKRCHWKVKIKLMLAESIRMNQL